ncbi:hypothetical protein DDE18_05855 [Nocardioides gansuensis]|uniref:Uncharacterized protein n=1 Tax=Nocardioides gansuensis TaxID=2138300 RepID=A0A2T8FDN6_9ACTN|nr:hypothetical protein [Nocardioides gansuensis]PVG83828.1 hypothetical protein DDE18_05855 [Nocardioides gansuensis]
MTGLLNDLMHDRADTLGAPDLDVATIVREGDRRLMRRRTAVVGGGVAAAVLTAVALPTAFQSALPSGDDRAVDPPFAAAFSAHLPVYALGSTVHVDGRTFDVGREVFSMVQTDTGVVFTDPDGTVWSATGSGEPVAVGSTHARHPRLETDASLVAWMEREGDQPVYAVLDQSSGEVRRSSLGAVPGMGWLRDEADPALVYAVDRQEVYVRDARGLVAWNPATDEQRVLGEAGGFTVDDVQAGLVAHGIDHPETGETTYRVGPALGEGNVVPAWNGFALSPDGRYLLGESDPDEAAVFDATTGTSQDAMAEGYSFSVFYGWVDEDSYVGLGMNKPYDTTPIDLLSCDVGAGCTVIAEAIGTIDDGVVIPIGESMDE